MSVPSTEAQDEKGAPVETVVNNEPSSLEEFEARCLTDGEYRQQYLDNPHDEKFEKFNQLMGEKMSGAQTVPQEQPAGSPQETLVTPAAQVPPASPATAALVEDEIAVSVRVPKSMLGTYLVNRKPEEALLEALRGNQEKDKYIDRLRTERDQYSGELINLKQEKVVPSQAAVPPAAQLPVEDPDLLSADAFSNLDMYDPENQEKLSKHFAAQARRMSSLEQLARSAVETTSQITAEKQQERERDLQSTHVTREYQDIEDLQTTFPELKTPKPFSQLDRDVGGFYRRIAESVQLPEQQALALYFAQTPEGQALRDKLSPLGVIPPEGYEVHQQIMAVRQERLRDQESYVEQLSKSVGKELKVNEVPLPPGMSYRDYWSKRRGAVVSQPSPTPAPIPAPYVPRTEHIPQYAPEVPPGQSVPLMGPENMDEAQKATLATKPIEQMSTDEAKLLARIYEAEKIPPPPTLLKKAGLI